MKVKIFKHIGLEHVTDRPVTISFSEKTIDMSSYWTLCYIFPLEETRPNILRLRPDFSAHAGSCRVSCENTCLTAGLFLR
jgi:hypothetical protein